MLKHISVAITVLLLALTSSAVLAQDMAGPPPKNPDGIPFGKWWQSPVGVKQLNLTREEIDTLDAAFDTRARKFMELKHSIELEQFDLNRMMENNTLDEPALMVQFSKLESARATLSEERFRYYVQIRKILGPDRFRKIKTFRERVHQLKKGTPKKGDRQQP
jgi:Spy/CpxP family protein refolding chaperone